jgi:transposase
MASDQQRGNQPSQSSLPGCDNLEQARSHEQVGWTTVGTPRLKYIDRRQQLLRPVQVDKLVAEDHAVRAIWELVGRLDLSAYYEPIRAVEGVAGRSATDPRLLISLWIYAYSTGVNSARQISRLCEYDPGYQWLTGLGTVNYHSLADFRVKYAEALQKLFVEVLGVLSAEGLVVLERVMHDGTKIKACASSDTFRRERRVAEHLELAHQQVRLMTEADEEEISSRVAQARRRAARERQERLELAMAELEMIRATKDSAQDKEEARVSMSDPEARIMKQADGGYVPSYNVQISTDAHSKIIVGVSVSQSGSDQGQLPAAVDRVEENAGKKPDRMVVDGGYVTRDTIMEMSQEQVVLIGPVPQSEAQCAENMKRRGVAAGFHPEDFRYDQSTDSYQCPGEKTLKHHRTRARKGYTQHLYAARKQDCQGCPLKVHCCPKNTHRKISRAVEGTEMASFRDRMETAESKAIYRQRGPVAEFSNAWIKSKLGLRQFRLRGLYQVGQEALWACLTYNVQQWIRLCWRVQEVG